MHLHTAVTLVSARVQAQIVLRCSACQQAAWNRAAAEGVMQRPWQACNQGLQVRSTLTASGPRDPDTSSCPNTSRTCAQVDKVDQPLQQSACERGHRQTCVREDVLQCAVSRSPEVSRALFGTARRALLDIAASPELMSRTRTCARYWRLLVVLSTGDIGGH